MDTKVYVRCLFVYSELDLGNDLPELFALSRGDIELKLGRGTRAVSASKGTGTPRGSTVNLGQVGQKGKDVLVAERNEDDPVVGQGRESAIDGHFLSSTRSASGNEDTCVLSSKSTLNPETTGSIPKGLPLSGERTVTSGDTKEEGVVVGELSGGDDGVVRLGWGMEFRQDVLGESFRDLEDAGRTTSGLETGLDALSELGNMAVESVDDDGNPWRRHCVCSEVMIADAGESVWDECISFYLYGSPWGWIA